MRIEINLRNNCCIGLPTQFKAWFLRCHGIKLHKLGCKPSSTI